MKGSLYIVSAPSGAGKTTLVNHLLEKDSNIAVSISTTTRAKRLGEQEGINYHFVSVDTFQQKVNEGEFLEHATVFDNFYGTSKANVERDLNAGKDVIVEIDWQGARQIREKIDNCYSIFILPPSSSELKRRLNMRGTDKQEVITRRMEDAVNEMNHYKEFDYIVINQNFNIALESLMTIFLSNRLKLNQQIKKHGALLESLVTK